MKNNGLIKPKSNQRKNITIQVHIFKYPKTSHFMLISKYCISYNGKKLKMTS